MKLISQDQVWRKKFCSEIQLRSDFSTFLQASDQTSPFGFHHSVGGSIKTCDKEICPERNAQAWKIEGSLLACQIYILTNSSCSKSLC